MKLLFWLATKLCISNYADIWLKKRKKCPECQSLNTVKNGQEDGKQTYLCKQCNRRFCNYKKESSLWSELWFSYVFHKQTLREISERNNVDWRTIRAHFKVISAPDKIHSPRPIHLVVDTTYFGKRKDGTSWGTMLFRDADTKENLWWQFVERETLGGYTQGKIELERLGYTISSVTADGFRGLPQVFKGIPFQACQFHIKHRCESLLTQNPQTEAGRILLLLVQSLPVSNSHDFRNRLRLFHGKYNTFISQRTIYTNGDSGLTHEGVHHAFYTLGNAMNYLFTDRKSVV